MHPIPYVQCFMTERTILGESKQFLSWSKLFVRFLKENNMVREGAKHNCSTVYSQKYIRIAEKKG